METALATTFFASSSSHHHKIFTYFNSQSFNSKTSESAIFSPRFLPLSPSLAVGLRFSSTRFLRCLPAGPGPPSPPGSDTSHTPGLAGKLSRFQDRAQIFFAVLFWMSLFFWASASDGRNSGRPSK
ncbi:hypothetical protein DITRI_Ditri19aG0123000 [Diplodiscus trichospermus]